MRIFKPFTSDDEIAAIGSGFLALTLPKAVWTHSAHFAATLWLMAHRPELDLPAQMPQFIRAYNAATGGVNSDTEGYHETITQASLRATRSFLAGFSGQNLFTTCNALMASPLGEPNWLLRYWSRERLSSVQARKSWVDPDLRLLPF
jgi:hypothetical protein